MLRSLTTVSAISVLALCSQFLITIQVGRQLGVAGYGEYVYIIAAVNLATMPIAMAVRQLLIRNLNSAGQSECIDLVRVLVLLLLVVVSCCIYIAYALLKGYWLYAFAVSLSIAILAQWMGSGYFLAIGQLLIGHSIEKLAHILPFILSLALYPYFFSDKIISEPLGVVGLYILSYIPLTLFLIVSFTLQRASVFRQLVSIFDNESSYYSSVRRFFPFIASNLVITLSNWGNLVIIGLSSNPSNVGMFSVAQQAQAVALMVHRSLKVITLRKIAKQWFQKRTKELQSYLVRSAKISTTFVVAFIILFSIFGERGIKYALGEEFDLVVVLTLILCLGSLVESGSGFQGNLLVMTVHQALFAKIMAIQAIVKSMIIYTFASLYTVFEVSLTIAIFVSISNIVLLTICFNKTNINPSIFPNRFVEILTLRNQFSARGKE